MNFTPRPCLLPEDRPASPGACGGPSRSGHSGWRGRGRGDRCALKVNSNTACKLLGCSPERAPAGTLPQRRALPQGLPGLQTPREESRAAPQALRRQSIYPPAQLPAPNPIPPRHRRTRARSVLPGSPWIRRCPGGDSGRRGRRPPSRWGSLRRRSLPTSPKPLLPKAKPPFERSPGAAWRAASAPAV